MATHADLNAELQATVNKRFEELLKEIGPNRQQLSTKVSMAFHELHKELTKAKVDAKRQGAMLMEIKNIERMAAQQLPHHLRKPAAASGTASEKKTANKPAQVKPAAKKSSPKKTATPAKKKKK